jgi:hypothetical protein
VCGISPEGYAGVSGVGLGGGDGIYKNGVRPAFCLPKSTAIQQADVNGESVYVLQE